jgi:hypothetical protein
MTHRSAVQALIVLATALTTSGAALAQTAPADPAPAPAPSLTGNISLTTNYKFRGQDQDMIGPQRLRQDASGLKPAIQGGFDYAFGDSGFYVGNWNSSVNWLQGNSIETDLYGGYKFKAGPVDLDVGAHSPTSTRATPPATPPSSTWRGHLRRRSHRLVHRRSTRTPSPRTTSATPATRPARA